MSLRGSRIVVIGGAAGMGLAPARAAVAEGALVLMSKQMSLVCGVREGLGQVPT